MFLAQDNVCGMSLLRLVARGNAIIAEMLRMKDHYHIVHDETTYGGVFFDFSYLKAPEKYESFINSNEDLLVVDEEFQENHMHLLERFYTLFESIYKYIVDYNRFVDDLVNGFFIQHSVVGVLLDIDGKQLLCEALYLYGVMLFLLHRCIPGTARERIVVSYLRYKGESRLVNLDNVIKLCREANRKTEPFGRFPVDVDVVKMITSRLQSDDVYLATKAFPSPEHRSVALANQASMLFVILHFLPECLIEQKATMREIVDKFFNDNWIIPIYMGMWVDLQPEWMAIGLQKTKDIANINNASGTIRFPESGNGDVSARVLKRNDTVFSAARDALKNSLESSHVKELVEQKARAVEVAQKSLDKYLTKGLLTDVYVLDNMANLLNSVRSANAAIRWLVLHRKTHDKQLRALIHGAVDAQKLINLLLSVSQLEIELKDILKRLLGGKQKTWEGCKKQCMLRMSELSNYFTGNVALTRVERDDTLVEWFNRIRVEIESLDYSTNPTLVGRRIQKVIGALEDVEQFSEIDTSLQIKQFLGDTRGLLKQMVRAVGLREEMLSTLEIVTDMSYAWEIIDDYREIIHSRIRKDPNAVASLRAVFLKLASILDVPLVRITQANSPDTASVAAYYSGELMQYVRRVLEIIPKTVFRVLTQIIDLQTHKLTLLPIKLEITNLQDYAQLDLRYELARMTYLVSVFTKGILGMQKTRTILGVSEVEPKQILQDGIRKELVQRISDAMQEELFFNTTSVQEIESKLERLAGKLDGFKRSFEYIQDYVNMYGLKVWQQEYSRVVNFNVEQECNRYLKRKILEDQSQYQSKTIPIPIYPDDKLNFIGRLEQALLDLTIPGPTVYAPEFSSWYDIKGGLVAGLRFWATLRRAVGVVGLCGVDRMLAFRVTNQLQKLVKAYNLSSYGRDTKATAGLTRLMPLLHELHGELKPFSKGPKDGRIFFVSAFKQSSQLTQDFLTLILQIGQAQLIRKQIANELNSTVQTESNQLYSALDALNKSLIRDIQDSRYRGNDQNNNDDKESTNKKAFELSKFLDFAGKSQPLQKIYIMSNPCDRLPELLFLVVAATISRLRYDDEFGSLIRKYDKDQPMDGSPLATGVLTILNQFHPSYTTSFFAYMGQYVRSTVKDTKLGSDVNASAKLDCRNAIIFLETMCKLGNIKQELIHPFVQPFLFDSVNYSVKG